MELIKLGWNSTWQRKIEEKKFSVENVARVAVENKGSYLLYAPQGELAGIVQGKFRRAAQSGSHYPKVGDWVLIGKLPQEAKAVIKEILPRSSKISRKQAGEEIEEQIIAANVDIVFVVQGLDGDFNLNRLERFVAMAREGGCEPIVLLNKSDLVADALEKKQCVEEILSGVKIFLLSAKEGQGVEQVRELIGEGVSVVFVGSSGAGKSTLVNVLLGTDKQKTGLVRADDSRGRHTTTKRELILLPGGGILIDTPGMRELGVWASPKAVAETFEDLEKIAQACRFRDCDHLTSQGCAVLEALEDGRLPRARYENYLKLSQELDPLKTRTDKKTSWAQKRILRKSKKRT